MAGVVFPDIGRTLGPLIQMDQQREDRREQNALRSQERADNLAFRKDESQYRRESLDEQRAMRLQSHIASLDEKTRAKVKDFSEFRSRGGMAVLSAPPEQRAQAYAMYVQEAKQRGYDMSLFPQQWGPATEQRLQFDVDQSKPFADFFSQPQAMPPVGGGAPAGAPATVAPDATKTGGQIVTRLTGTHGFSPAAAAGVTGGLYQESGFDPGYGFTRPGGDNGTAHGIAQWRHDRAQGLVKFAQAAGKPPTDLDTQVDYLVSEMKGGDMGAQRAYAMLQQAKTPEEATVAMMHFFRPAGYTPNNPQGGHGFQQRVQYAQRFGSPADAGAVAGNPAPMPNVSPQQVGAVPGTPAQMPGGPQFAQAGGTIPQGDAVAGQGDVMTPPRAAPPSIGSEVDDIRKQTRASGGDIFTVKGQVEIQNGNYVVRSLQNPRQIVGMIPVKGKDSGPSGPFAGNNPDVQAFNYLVSTGKMTVEQAANVLGGKSITNPADGSVIFVPATQLAGAGSPQGQAPGTPGVAAASSPNAAPGTIPLTPPKKDPVFKKLETEIRSVESAVNNFQKVIGEAGGGSWRAFVNDPTSPDAQKVLGAFNAMKTALRSEAFINTGVLQPAEMKMIDDMLLSPQSVRGALATPEAYAAMLGQVLTFVRNKHDAAAAAYGQSAPPSASSAPAAAPPKVGDTQEGYLFKGGDPSKPESWEKVQ